MSEIDTQEGGDALSVEQAAAAYAKTASEAVETDQADIEDNDEGDTTDDELQASGEDEGEEADGETGDEDQAEDDDTESDTESDQGRFVSDNAKVRLPDGTVTTIADLKQGSLRNADYTRKTQEVAEQRRALETQSHAIQASQQQIEQQRQYMASLLQSIVPPPPDPTMLNTDPMGYMTQKAQHEQWVAHLSYLQQEEQRTEQERQAQASESERETANREWQALLDKAPELKDEKRVNRFVSEVREHGTSYGFTPEELRTVALDHRQALVLKDAIAWRKLQASKGTIAKKVEGRPPVTKGGKRLSSGAQKARHVTDAITRLKQTGSVEDATAAYLASLNKG